MVRVKEKKVKQKQIIIDSLLINYYILDLNLKNIPLLFLHGWNCDSSVWWPILPELRKLNSNLYFLDLPGFGKSEIPKKPFSLLDYSQIVKKFLEKLTLKKVTLVGHSVGGAIAVKFASENGQFLKSLILVDSAGIRLKMVKKIIYKILAKIVKPVFKIQTLQPLRYKIYKMIGSEDYLLTPEMRKTYQAVVNEDITKALGRIKTPSLIIWGEKDKETPLWQARIFQERIKNAKLLTISATGHFCFLEKPKQFLKILKSFLKNE